MLRWRVVRGQLHGMVSISQVTYGTGIGAAGGETREEDRRDGNYRRTDSVIRRQVYWTGMGLEFGLCGW